MKYIDTILKKWKIKCVIFDLDGTLVNTLDKHIQAFVKLFEEIQIDIPVTKIAENMGRTPWDTLLSLIPELSIEKAKLEKLANRKEEILTTLLKEIPVLPGAYKIVRYLNSKKVKLALASSTPNFNVTKMITMAGFTGLFDAIVTGEDITIGKPNPEVFLKAAEKTEIDKNFCLVIGDSPHDIEAAKAAGMKIISVTTGEHTKKQIVAANPDKIISSLEKLLD
jgi:beta-phosphoglucomutase